MIRLFVLLALASCQEGTTMTTPHDLRLAASKIPNLATTNEPQLGQSVQMIRSPMNGANAIAAKDVVRWKGTTEYDVQPLRIYLGPWQPRPDLPGAALPATYVYAKPTPWSEPPNRYDSMIPEFFDPLTGVASMLYARITFGAGGVVHQAYVDWPPRGLLLQVSASYVQVDGVGGFTPPGGVNEAKLPLLQAHVAPEPGGGDAANSATYTYPTYNSGDVTPVVFQVPPFARAFTPVVPRQTLLGVGFNIISMTFTELGMDGSSIIGSRIYNVAVGADFPDDRALPLSGTTSMVVVDAIQTGPAPGTVFCGMMFHLDL